jgi:hypothetical protein
MRRIGFAGVPGIVLLLAVAAAPAYGQAGGTTGSVQGIVADTGGGVLPGVTVTATSPNELGARTALTNERGEYRFPVLSPGTYKLVFELQGFGTLTRENIAVHVSGTATVDVQMPIAGLAETLTVTGQAAVVDTASMQFQRMVSHHLHRRHQGSSRWFTVSGTSMRSLHRPAASSVLV